MKTIMRILVPVDFSAESKLALEMAVTVARNRPTTTIYLMHSMPLGQKPERLGMASIGYEMEMELAKRRMKEAQDLIPYDVLSFPIFESGPVPQAVARTCEDKNVDFVIMTTRGRRGFTHVLDGSITEETVRLAPCPVLVLHLNDQTMKLAQDEPDKKVAANQYR